MLGVRTSAANLRTEVARFDQEHAAQGSEHWSWYSASVKIRQPRFESWQHTRGKQGLASILP
eukprot:1640065-Prymnesium_polylepis.1